MTKQAIKVRGFLLCGKGDHQRDLVWWGSINTNYCRHGSCYQKLCVGCAAKVEPRPDGGFFLWCEDHAKAE